MSSHTHTPSRISLRRRCQNVDSKQESTPLKLMSPSQEVEYKEAQNNYVAGCTQKGKETCTSFMTPKSCRRKKKLNVSRRKTPSSSSSSFVFIVNGGKKQNQDSSPILPISPFTSSQIPSTQDCEVVWDCNSPGYSKDDLKEMHGNSNIAKSCTISPITTMSNQCIPNKSKRLLELPTRIGVQNSNSVAEELDNLLTRVNVEITNDEVLSTEDPFWTDFDPGSDFLKESSQPFETSRIVNRNTSVEQSENKINLPASGCFSGKMKKEERVSSMCMDRTELQGDGAFTTDPKRENIVDASFSSMDEDLFNESFLQSTQALEDAYFDHRMGRVASFTDPSNRREGLSPLSRIRKKKKTILPENRYQQDFQLFSLKASSPVCYKGNFMCKNDLGTSVPENLSAHTEKVSETAADLDSIKEVLMLNHQNSVTYKAKNINGDFKSKQLDFGNITSVNSTKQKTSFQLKSSECETEVKQNDFQKPDTKMTKKITNKGNLHSTLSHNEIGTKVITRSTSDCTRPVSSAVRKYGSFDRPQSHSLDSDDDDEIFASLIPTLIAVEAEHMSGGLTQCIQNTVNINNEENSNDPFTRIFPSSYPANSICNKWRDVNHSQEKESNCNKASCSHISNYSSVDFHDTLFKLEGKENTILNGEKHCYFTLKECNKGESAGKPTLNYSSIGNSQDYHLKASQEKHQIENSPILQTIGCVKEDSILKCNSVGSEMNNGEEDDDDLFLREEVLDYISLVESKYTANQFCVEKSDDGISLKQILEKEKFDERKQKPLSLSRMNLKSDGGVSGNRAESFRSSQHGIPKNKGTKGSQPHDADAKSHLDSSFKSSVLGLEFFVDEIEKIDAAANRLNKVIKGGGV